VKAANTPTINFIRGSKRGFTLAESLIGISVLAIATVGIVAPILAAGQQACVSDELTTASLLARQLLNEIASRPFLDPVLPGGPLGPGPGETSRALYDCVGDYSGYSDTTSTLATMDGVSVSSTAGGSFKRQVQAEYRTTPTGSAAASGDFIVVTVTVTTPSNQLVTAQRLFANYTRK
jgi:prepilin-type N-terminal cleavage/methylation domain-containing protein